MFYPSSIQNQPPEGAKGKTIYDIDEETFLRISIDGSSQEGKSEPANRSFGAVGISIDILGVRHPIAGAPLRIIPALRKCRGVSLLNLGDGIGEHFTQGVLDMCTLRDRYGSFSGLNGIFIGDLLRARTMHSFLRALTLFPNNHVCLLAPPGLELPPEGIDELQTKGLGITIIKSVEEIPHDRHFGYLVRSQNERGGQRGPYVKADDEFMEKHLPHGVLMHPGPALDEVSEELDDHPRVICFDEEIRMGPYTRMGTFTLMLGLEDRVPAALSQ